MGAASKWCCYSAWPTADLTILLLAAHAHSTLPVLSMCRCRCVSPCVVCPRFDFEGVDVRALLTELQSTDKRIKELKEQGIQPQVRFDKAQGRGEGG